MADNINVPNADSGISLGDTFRTVNSFRHTLMDISMIGMAIGGIMASGGATAFLDPFIGWAQMHVAGIPELITGGPEFLSNAWEQAQNGVFLTAEGSGAAMMTHGAGEHAMHAAHSAAMDSFAPAPALSNDALEILGVN